MKNMRMIVSLMALLFIVAPAWAMETEQHETEASKIHFHGYGELHYNSPMVDGTGFPEKELPPTLDFHRLVLGWDVTLSDKISLHTEFDFEHAAKELELEFAYLDFLVRPAFNVRAGAMLMPVGPLNENHEPPLFYSVERPYVQKYIIPTTWQEGGVGIFGEPVSGVRYRVYIVEGLNAKDFSSNGIKGGRQVLFEDENVAKNFGGVGRVEYTGRPGQAFGASFYSAGAAQGNGSTPVTLWDVDAKLHLKGLELTALYVATKVGNAEKITKTKTSCVSTVPTGGGTGTETCTDMDSPREVGEKMVGWYGEAAYRLGSFVPFVRWEKLNTQDKVPAGASYPADSKNDRKVTTYGVAYYPHPDVAVKIDHELWKDGTGADGTRTNVGLAFLY